MFWVQQKDRYLRQLLIRDIEDQTGRRLIVYFANRFKRATLTIGMSRYCLRSCMISTERQLIF